ncbi:hypothetical protein M405DRAFT_583565 [Rhizopogon salebrosus TDB-379]|nr:hypothetical protein M405DRAFT_583565 [Rhizopogon salebrosus TDB-379]
MCMYNIICNIHPPTLQISSSYFLLTHSIKTRPLSLHAGQYFIRLSGPMVQCSQLPKRSKLLTVMALCMASSLECMNYRDNDEVATLTDPLAYHASLFTL